MGKSANRRVCTIRTDHVLSDDSLTTFKHNLCNASYKLFESDDLLGAEDIDTQLFQPLEQNFFRFLLRYSQSAFEWAWKGAEIDLDEDAIPIAYRHGFRLMAALEKRLSAADCVEELAMKM
jgi:hypothetical protein